MSSSQAQTWEKTWWIQVPFCSENGVFQMALDRALLDWVNHAPAPCLVVRTYHWAQPTLSLGVHQKEQDIEAAYHEYQAYLLPGQVVRRPTGGRAILHGTDRSYAFVTNLPQLRQLSVKDSYCVLTDWIQAACHDVGMALSTRCDTDPRAYARSPLCFETATASDLMTPMGHKVSGAAQVRKAQSLLHHGAMFLDPVGIDPDVWEQALVRVLERTLGQPPEELSLTEPQLATLLESYQAHYEEDAVNIWTKLSTTSGSHLVPASD